MKKTFAVVVMAAVMGACAEGPMDPVDGPLFGKGAASPNQAINGTFVIAAGDLVFTKDGTYRSTGDSNNGQGSCATHAPSSGKNAGVEGPGYYYNPASQQYNGPNHSQCANGTWEAAGTSEIELAIFGTYVEARNGNVNLNFAGCDLDEFDGSAFCTLDNFIHYHIGKGHTTGSGSVITGEWAIDLTFASGAGNTMLGRTVAVYATNMASEAQVFGSLKW
jgi:hypothetical protein